MKLTRTQLATRFGISSETLRFYERKQLLCPERDVRTNYRYYDEQAIKRLKFILKAKSHGFTLTEIKELLKLRIIPDSSCTDVRIKAQQKLQLIEQKIEELIRIKTTLKELIASCNNGNRVNECPLIEAFEN